MIDSLNDQFVLRAETPAIWALSARRLKWSGDLLFDAYAEDLEAMASGVSPLELRNLEVAGPATLLLGLATENILKAIAMQKDPQSVKNGKIRDWPSGHDLVRLSGMASVALNNERRDLLQRMGRFVEWAGRYPVPKKVTKLGMKQTGINRPFPPLPLQPHERPGFNTLFDELYSVVITDVAGSAADDAG